MQMGFTILIGTRVSVLGTDLAFNFSCMLLVRCFLADIEDYLLKTGKGVVSG